MKTAPAATAWLIVNADDYGYFRCVSRGILQAANEGIVTATGVMANGPHFRECVGWLGEAPALDLGIHLNLTLGEPLTADLRRHLNRWAGRLPDKFSLASAVLRGALPRASLATELRAQIERCLDAGLVIRFLNGHEHVHMLPALHRITLDLAEGLGLTQVRLTRPERLPGLAPGPMVRDLALRLLAWRACRNASHPAPRFLGLADSGRLDGAALQRTLARLRPGQIHELMCHPGRFEPQEITDPALLRYHRWQAELDALTAPGLREALRSRGIALIGYRDLGAALAVRTPARLAWTSTPSDMPPSHLSTRSS